MSQVILASSSPRRKELLSTIIAEFDSFSPDVDESTDGLIPPYDVSGLLAVRKARTAVTAQISFDYLIASDTVVISEGEILGKPDDRFHARKMLMELRNKTHEVSTSVAVVSRESNTTELAISLVTNLSRVTMRPYSDLEVSSFLDRGEADDKAGGYAIQDLEFHPVSECDGCTCAVMGLPIQDVVLQLALVGFDVVSSFTPNRIYDHCKSCLRGDLILEPCDLSDVSF
ncbi:MAG: Maf family protein [Dehalococcoidia bacterium]|nr:Maf family protein [Dehalococcoidia bacterium]